MVDIIGPKLPDTEEEEPKTAQDRTPRRALSYAPGHQDLFRRGGADDPMSEAFVPLEQRDPIEKARLFAKQARKTVVANVEFD